MIEPIDASHERLVHLALQHENMSARSSFNEGGQWETSILKDEPNEHFGNHELMLREDGVWVGTNSLMESEHTDADGRYCHHVPCVPTEDARHRRRIIGHMRNGRSFAATSGETCHGNCPWCLNFGVAGMHCQECMRDNLKCSPLRILGHDGPTDMNPHKLAVCAHSGWTIPIRRPKGNEANHNAEWRTITIDHLVKKAVGRSASGNRIDRAIDNQGTPIQTLMDQFMAELAQLR